MSNAINKDAVTRVPILDALARRWSTRAFADRAVEAEKLIAVLEAARWASSSLNLQPWRLIVATKADPAAYARLLDCLKEGNQHWASRAPVLILTVAHVERKPGVPNRHALHDVGLAVGNLAVQATALGLYLRQMGGFYPEKARETYRLPADYEPVTTIALGYRADPDDIPEDLRERELAVRQRKPLGEIVFNGDWGVPFVPEEA